jgi:hypothetical protein
MHSMKRKKTNKIEKCFFFIIDTPNVKKIYPKNAIKWKKKFTAAEFCDFFYHKFLGKNIFHTNLFEQKVTKFSSEKTNCFSEKKSGGIFPRLGV